ncbi:hypothetical protein N483_26915 [Pseudoalteromonas luteoviolacea NCIMB 1944]|uniref:Uncharacterized protein n=1 Tax=Pseudoalteromonas luteoviolacea (strain 2ta16) TaxID=1353533 RepID=V4HX63_PSEL2|nr:hypothetical protein PL2TA16_04137 [Pseudoalteromonas luteoviolacea 2ta16]KZN32736.1 hypothetical protein N483_26915 [Pseudoalteromonas luteoviolacea NCIMB 1944]
MILRILAAVLGGFLGIICVLLSVIKSEPVSSLVIEVSSCLILALIFIYYAVTGKELVSESFKKYW